MAVRRINDPKNKGPQGTATFHNAATRSIRFTAGWMGGPVEMDPGDEIQVPIGLTFPNGRLKRVRPSPAIGGKRALYFVCPYLAEGPAPRQAEPRVAKQEPAAEADAERESTSKPKDVEDEASAEVAKLVREHSRSELRGMAKDLGVDVRGNLSEQVLAERIVKVMS